MKFNTARKMLDVIQQGNDLYDRATETIVAVYNEEGSIVVARMDPEIVDSGKERIIERGYIFDDPLCECYNEMLPSNLDYCECSLDIDWEILCGLYCEGGEKS